MGCSWWGWLAVGMVRPEQGPEVREPSTRRAEGEHPGEKGARPTCRKAEVASRSLSCPHTLGFAGRAEAGEEEDGQTGHAGTPALPHRGLGARLSLQGQLVELILRLILIQRHLGHMDLITPLAPAALRPPLLRTQGHRST